MTPAGSPRTQRAGWGASLGGNPGPATRDGARPADRADEPADHGRWMHRWLWPAVAAVAVAAAMTTSGVEPWRAIAVAAGVAMALWALIATVAVPRIAWPDDIPGQQYAVTSTWEVPGLTGARESGASFESHLRPRLWATAAQLLEARGIDPTGGEARDLIGRSHYDVLTGVNTDPRTVTGSVSALSLVIARLAVDRSLPGRPPVDAPGLAGLAGAPRGRGACRHAPTNDAATNDVPTHDAQASRAGTSRAGTSRAETSHAPTEGTGE